MTADQWRRLEELFSRAAEMDAQDALPFLEKECKDDPSMLREALDLLAEHRQIEDEKMTGPADIGRLVSRRFTLLEKVGSGTFGDVYKAHDYRRDKTVSLKILRATSAAALLHFKQEFRTISQVRHPNLVELHEFFAIEDRWMFTMELIGGDDFLRYVEGERQSTWNEREGRIRRRIIALVLGRARTRDRFSALHSRCSRFHAPSGCPRPRSDSVGCQCAAASAAEQEPGNKWSQAGQPANGSEPDAIGRHANQRRDAGLQNSISEDKR